jgi:peptidoglycan/LPS O-acetylase OafA/YrhL/lysophospholipase L1-like esterase
VKTSVGDERSPLDQGLSYVPALDGIRALAVLAVMGFHGGVPWLRGGFLGVDTFFVLSGFLITTLLLDEWRRSQAVALGAFWARRARRLLPALVVLVVVVGGVAALFMPPGTYPDLRLDAFSALLYVANWHYVVAGSSYFGQTGPVSPLTHTWSLGIEEQFYLVWPLIVLAVLRLTRKRSVLLAVCIGGAVASALEMALLFRAGTAISRLYYGTDTHAQSLLVGAALAVGLATRRPRTGADHRLAVLGGVGAVGTALLWWRLSGTAPLLYQGGFLVAGVCTAAVVTCAVRAPHSLVARVLSLRPMRFLGRISYGLYLWHYPLFLWIDGARTGLTGYALLGVRCAVTLCVATASYVLIERPMRTGGILRGRRAWALTPVAAVATCAVVLAATTVPAVPVPAPPAVAATSGAKVKVLLLGDSVSVTLGIGLASDAAAFGAEEFDEGIIGCGVAVGTWVLTRGTVVRPPPPCRAKPPPPGTPLLVTTPAPIGRQARPLAERWTAWDAHWMATIHPAVVAILAGRWEITDRTYDGRWTDILHPTFARYVKQQLERVVALAHDYGARAVLLTAPCFDPGEQPDGTAWPTSSPQRLAAYNRLVREVAAASGGEASVLNLDGLVCPGGRFSQDLGGVEVRTPDGVHFTVTGGRYLGPRIWPTLVKAAQVAPRPAAAAAAASGSAAAAGPKP